MRLPTRPLIIVLAVVLIGAAPFLQAASESETGGSGGKDFAGKVVNFVILFGGLVFVLRKPLAKFLKDKSEGVRLTLVKAEEADRDARAKLSLIEKRVGSLEAEVDDLKKKAETEGQAEKERIMLTARREADRLKEFSRQEIEANVRGGVRQLKEYSADKALELALDRVRSRLTPESHARLIDRAIERLTEVHEKTDPGTPLRPRTH